jgi:hypothetical protein
MKVPTKRIPTDIAVCPECRGMLHLIYAERFGGVDPGSAAEVVPGKVSATCFNRRCPRVFDSESWTETVEKLKSWDQVTDE